MVFVKDAHDLKFVRINRAGEGSSGVHEEELLGKSDYDFFPKNEADFFTAKDRAVLTSAVSSHSGGVHPYAEKGRSFRCIRRRFQSSIQTAARSTCWRISEDITEKRFAEEERERARSRVSNLEAERSLRECFVFPLSHDLRTP